MDCEDDVTLPISDSDIAPVLAILNARWMSTAEIADRIALTAPQIIHRLNEAEARGLVERRKWERRIEWRLARVSKI